MSKLALHLGKYKKEQVALIWKHNMRKNKNYGNSNIDPDISNHNIVLKQPSDTLYKEIKRQIEGRVTGRVNKASVWLVEGIVHLPSELIDSSREDKGKFFEDVLEYLEKKFGKENVVLAVVHMDEHGEGSVGRCHLHFDITPITPDGRLSARSIMTRNGLRDMHTELSDWLREREYPVERGSSTKGKKLKSLSVNEYKERADAVRCVMEEERRLLERENRYLEKTRKRLEQNCDDLIDIQTELAEENIELAHAVLEDAYMIRERSR